MKTLRGLTLTIEMVGIIVIIICSSILLQNVKAVIVNDEIEDQRSTLEEINYYLNTSLDENMREFIKISEDLEQNKSAIDLDMFSDMYYIDANMRLVEILTKDKESLIFTGYDVSASKLGAFLETLEADTPKISPMMRSLELDTMSVYVGLKTDKNYLVGRIGLEKIMNYLKISAQGQGAIIVVASNDGYVIDSTDISLPFYVVPEFESDTAFEFEDYFLFKQNNDYLGDDLLVLVPKTHVLELLERINEQLPIFFVAIIIFVLLKIIAQEYLIIKPLQRLSSTVESWEVEVQPTMSYKNVLDTKEIKAISNQFTIKSVEIQAYIEELNGANRELEILNKDLEIVVENRTKELTDAIGKLIQSEKLAALSHIVAGVAHEVSTPIGVCVTTNSFLKGELEKLISTFESNQMSKQSLMDFLVKLDESIRIIDNNLIRTVDLVQSFKQVAVDQVSDMHYKFSIKENIEMVVTSLKHEYKRYNVKFKIDCSDALYLSACPGEFSQIFTNFIMNSLHHGFKTKEDNEIAIKCICEDKKFIVEYWDNGIGISEGNIHRIFDPFFTTNRKSGNSGLGMNIVYSLVNRMSGKISCKSGEGKGVYFKIEIPISEDFKVYSEANN